MNNKSLLEELEMIARGDHEEIMACIKEDEFYEETEISLIARYNHDEIMAYVSRWCMGYTAELALIARGNHEEIMTYLTSHRDFLFTPAFERAVIDRGNAKEIEAMKARKS